MKRKYIHMSMLIEGPKQPGNNINLYLGLLKEELDTMWKTPANTWDAAEKEYFPMRAALLKTVHDYLGSDISRGRWSTNFLDASGAWMTQRIAS